MTQLEDTLTAIDGARQNLAEDLASQEWGSANKSLRSLAEEIDALGGHIDGTADDARYNELVAVYNGAADQHNQAIDTLNAAGQHEGWRIGDTRPCGCPVEALSVACPSCDQHHGQAMTDCGECQFGVPGVRHWNQGCEDPK